MIFEASKYGAAREQAGRENPKLTKPRGLVRTPGLPGERARKAGESPAIFIPRIGKEIRFDEWYWRELREGGFLANYLAREKHRSGTRLRHVARRMDGYQQNNKSELRMVAAVPAREFLRWKKEDPDFWMDDANLRSFRRDNADACVYL